VTILKPLCGAVQWREERYRVGRDGSVQLVEDLTP
jgi:hypothetical protein